VSIRTVSSLVADEILSRALTAVRKRAARNPIFAGLAISIDDPISLRLISTGLFEATQFDGIAQLLESPTTFGLPAKPAGLFIDVGANIGLFTVALSGSFDRTLAIEANPITFAILQANILSRELSSVHAVCVAASDSSASSMIFVPADGSLGGATLNPNQHIAPKKIEINCRPLDDLVDEFGGGLPVGLIKIDVQDHELNVLRGAPKTLSLHHAVVLFEAVYAFEATQCANLLVECGYKHFFSFKRGRAGGRLKTVLTGLINGLDVYPEHMTIDSIRPSPLICATK
jgi:FkbM family methyltransferase